MHATVHVASVLVLSWYVFFFFFLSSFFIFVSDVIATFLILMHTLGSPCQAFKKESQDTYTLVLSSSICSKFLLMLAGILGFVTLTPIISIPGAYSEHPFWIASFICSSIWKSKINSVWFYLSFCNLIFRYILVKATNLQDQTYQCRLVAKYDYCRID